MASVNKALLIGNLGEDPNIKYLGNGNTGTTVANVSMATTSIWKDKTGEKQEQTEWHRVVFYGKLAEIVQQFLHKGSQIYVEGRLQTRKWTDKTTGVDRYTTEVIASEMKMLGPRAKAPEKPVEKTPSHPHPRDDFKDMYDDIPF